VERSPRLLIVDQGFGGKNSPPLFSSTLSEELCRSWLRLFDRIDRAERIPCPVSLNRPARMLERAMACLHPGWTDMGVDPMGVELVRETVDVSHEVRCGDKVVGTLVIEDVDAVVEPNYGIAE
jgi:hypothetical protein